MQLHQLQVKLGKRGQRIGRGGKRGTTSGRGQKGQKSRSGRRIRPAERDLILRLPKRRGFANRAKSRKPAAFNLGDISAKLKESAGVSSPRILNEAFLRKAGFLPENYYGDVKILGDGEIGLPVVVDGLKVSKGAREKIEKAGGRIVGDEPRPPAAGRKPKIR